MDFLDYSEMDSQAHFQGMEENTGNTSLNMFPLVGNFNGSGDGAGNFTMDGYPFGGSNVFSSIISVMDVYVTPIIIIIGMVGNTFCFLVYVFTPHLWRQSSSIYLAFLAAVNNGFLISLLIVWVSWVGIHVFHKTGWCQMTQYVKGVCYFLSAWTVVSFTVERWIVVFYPLKRHQLCTRKRAVVVMTSLTVSALTFYSYSIWTTGVHVMEGIEVCATNYYYDRILKTLQSIDTILVVIVPLFTIVIMNASIGIKICHYTNYAKSIPFEPGSNNCDYNPSKQLSLARSKYNDSVEFSSRHMTRLNTTSQGQQMITKPRAWRIMTRRQHTQLRITRALLVVSTVFVLLTLPSSAMKLQLNFLTLTGKRYSPTANTLFWAYFLELLNYMNFSSSFFLLSACSRNFRHALKKMLRRFWHKVKSTLSHRCYVLYTFCFQKQEDID